MRAMTLKNGETDLTLTSRVHFRRGGKGRLELASGPRPVSDDVPAGRVPRSRGRWRWPSGCRGCSTAAR